MANILDYVYWRGDLSFKQSSFTILDNLIFSELSYLDYEGAISSYPTKEETKFKDALEYIFTHQKKEKMVMGLILPQTIVELADKCKSSHRFGKIKASNYINLIDIETKTQFSAMVFHISQDVLFLAFRGTDDTLIGWQENVDLLYTNPVGAQTEAIKYVEKIAELFPNTKILMGGHSKGGNLANYAAIHVSPIIQDRIISCYSNDGQGIRKEFVDMDKYNRVKDKIIHIIPEESVVGMIFDHFAGKTIVCKSTAKGLYQHDGFSWQIKVTDFDSVSDVSNKAKKLDNALTKMIHDIPDEDKILLGKNLYDFILASQLNTLLDCKKESLKLLKYLNHFEGKSKQIFLQLVSEFIFY